MRDSHGFSPRFTARYNQYGGQYIGISRDCKWKIKKKTSFLSQIFYFWTKPIFELSKSKNININTLNDFSESFSPNSLDIWSRSSNSDVSPLFKLESESEPNGSDNSFNEEDFEDEVVDEDDYYHDDLD